MPRTRFDAKSRKADKLVVLIWGNMEAKEISPSVLADVIGVCEMTVYRRKKHPEKFGFSRIRKYH